MSNSSPIALLTRPGLGLLALSHFLSSPTHAGKLLVSRLTAVFD